MGPSKKGVVSVSAAELTQTPSLVTVRIHLPLFESLHPYYLTHCL